MCLLAVDGSGDKPAQGKTKTATWYAPAIASNFPVGFGTI